MSENRIDYSQWLYRGKNTFFPTDNSRTITKLPSGVYNIAYGEQVGFYMVKRDLQLDELLDLPSEETLEVLSNIDRFWQRADKFKEYGYSHKRGVLLYGSPGVGKTSIINLIIDKLIKNDEGIVITISGKKELEMYERFMGEIFRQIEPHSRIITVIEDIDGYCNSDEVESMLINVLDGINQIDNVLYLATTNYPERISSRIMKRPNRFDLRIEVTYPSGEARRKYFESKLKEKDKEVIDIEEWVKATEHFTIAHLGELVKSVVVIGDTFEKSISRIRSHIKDAPSSRNLEAEFSSKIGFGK